MSDYNSTRFLFYDYGLFISAAKTLARKSGTPVGYFCPWEGPFTDGRELVIGEGLEGIERVKYFDRDLDDYDVIVFPDCHDGTLVDYLRKQGHSVWGSGLGSEIELLRWKTKERFRQAGMPHNESHKVHGTTELRKFFRDNGDDNGWYVKVSGLRGLGETWFARNYDEAKGIIDEFESKNGGLSYLIDFIIEARIADAVESGYDGFCINGKFPTQSHYGIEKKDAAYFGMVRPYDDLPDDVRAVNDALSPVLAELEYRNFLSSELRNGIPIDMTARHASPAGECFVENIINLPELLARGAKGELVEPELEFKYAAQIMLCSEWGEAHWQMVSFPEEIRPYVKLYNHCWVDDGGEIGMADYFVPQVAPMKQIGSVIALADDPQEAIKVCQERAIQVKGFDLESDGDALDKAADELLEFSPALA